MAIEIYPIGTRAINDEDWQWYLKMFSDQIIEGMTITKTGNLSLRITAGLCILNGRLYRFTSNETVLALANVATQHIVIHHQSSGSDTIGLVFASSNPNTGAGRLGSFNIVGGAIDASSINILPKGINFRSGTSILRAARDVRDTDDSDTVLSTGQAGRHVRGTVETVCYPISDLVSTISVGEVDYLFFDRPVYIKKLYPVCKTAPSTTQVRVDVRNGANSIFQNSYATIDANQTIGTSTITTNEIPARTPLGIHIEQTDSAVRGIKLVGEIVL